MPLIQRLHALQNDDADLIRLGRLRLGGRGMSLSNDQPEPGCDGVETVIQVFDHGV